MAAIRYVRGALGTPGVPSKIPPFAGLDNQN